MNNKIIDGKLFAKQIREEIRIETDEIIKSHNIRPNLTVIIVGENPASEVYVRNKEKFAKEVGFESDVIRLPQNIEEENLLCLIEELNANEKINGILVQLPLPDHIDDKKVIEKISSEKDVDGFSVANIGKVVTGLKGGIEPCTPKGIIYLLEKTIGDLSGKNAVVIGRSNIVGKPVSMMLLSKNATVTVTHSKTKNLRDITSKADIIIAACGISKFIKASDVKRDVVIIDVGINRLDNGTLCGDVDFDDVLDKVSYITPVPGGVGPMTIAMLLRNTLDAFYMQKYLTK